MFFTNPARVYFLMFDNLESKQKAFFFFNLPFKNNSCPVVYYSCFGAIFVGEGFICKTSGRVCLPVSPQMAVTHSPGHHPFPSQFLSCFHWASCAGSWRRFHWGIEA